jgi:hypothetical protein
MRRKNFFLFCCKSPLLIRFSNRKAKSKMGESTIGDENLQTIYRWIALTEENILEWFISSFMRCTLLALKGKEIRCDVQLGDLGNNQINWRFREIQMGPTMLLKSLLAQEHHSSHNFLRGVGAQDLGLVFAVSSNWCLRRKELGLKHKMRQLSPSPRWQSWWSIWLQRNTIGSISTVQLSDEGLELCYVSDPWDQRNTIYARRNTIELQLNPI